MRKTHELLSRFWHDEEGAAAAEYALLLAIIAAGLAVAAGTLGSAISNALDNVAGRPGGDGDGALTARRDFWLALSPRSRRRLRAGFATTLFQISESPGSPLRPASVTFAGLGDSLLDGR